MKRLSDIGEFQLIERILQAADRREPNRSHVRIGIGDDAAVLRLAKKQDCVVTTDVLVENRHFQWGRESDGLIGWKALAANLSDLAAMGSTPIGFTLAISARPRLELGRLDRVLQGMLDLAERERCPLIGGNISGARETSLAITALGSNPQGKSLQRQDARIGDQVFVTGHPGRAALALARSRKRGTAIRFRPVPRVETGRKLLRRKDRGACIDLSDGLSSDLLHLLTASNLGMQWVLKKKPFTRSFERECDSLGLDPLQLWMSGGEDYELLFTLRSNPSVMSLEKQFGHPVCKIGQVVHAKEGDLISPSGWKHF